MGKELSRSCENNEQENFQWVEAQPNQNSTSGRYRFHVHSMKFQNDLDSVTAMCPILTLSRCDTVYAVILLQFDPPLYIGGSQEKAKHSNLIQKLPHITYTELMHFELAALFFWRGGNILFSSLGDGVSVSVFCMWRRVIQILQTRTGQAALFIILAQLSLVLLIFTRYWWGHVITSGKWYVRGNDTGHFWVTTFNCWCKILPMSLFLTSMILEECSEMEPWVIRPNRVPYQPVLDIQHEWESKLFCQVTEMWKVVCRHSIT